MSYMEDMGYDGWDDYPGEPDDYPNYPYHPYRYKMYRTCKYCKKNKLLWLNTGQGWRLTDQFGYIHVCEDYRNERL